MNVLPPGTFQFEGGFDLTGRSEGISVERTLADGNPMVRLGIGRRMELRFGGDGLRLYSHRAGDARQRIAGASDSLLGVKLGLVSEKGRRPAFTLISMVSLPVGHQAFTSDGYDPTFKLSWSKSIGENASVAGNVSFSSLSDPAGRFVQGAVSYEVSRNLWRNWAGFWEAYLVTPIDRAHDRAWAFDAGVMHPIGRNVQFDLSVGQQLVPLTRTWFVAMGLVVRRPLWFPARR